MGEGLHLGFFTIQLLVVLVVGLVIAELYRMRSPGSRRHRRRSQRPL